MSRFSPKLKTTLGLVLPAALLAVGLVVGQLRSSEWQWRLPLLSEVGDFAELEPIRALPRTEAVLATIEARRYLDHGRPYAAWESLRDHLDYEGTAGNAATLMAAEAASAWGGWSEVRQVLDGRDWLADARDGEGLFLLARANEELNDLSAAESLYRRYLDRAGAPRRNEAAARMGEVLARRGDHLAAAEWFSIAAADEPLVADWLRVLQVREMVEGGDPAATSVAISITGGSPTARTSRILMEARAWMTAAQTDKAIERLEWEARVLNASGAPAEAASLRLEEGRLLLGSPNPLVGRNLLGYIAADTAVPAGTRVQAAELLDDLDDPAAAELLAAADAYAAADRPGLAARAMADAFEAGSPATPMQRYRRAKLLYEARDYGVARSAFNAALEGLPDGPQRADAALYAARSLFRADGSSSTRRRNREAAMAELKDVASRYPGTAAAGTALFLLGDEASTLESGINYYRQAAEVTAAPEAREALFRVGDRRMRLDNQAGAISAWTEYVRQYPRGDATAEVAYRLGKMHSDAGRRADARAMFAAAIVAEPTSYYAVRAAERLETQSLATVLEEPRPWAGLASEPAEAAEYLRRYDRLSELGLEEQARTELDYAQRALKTRPLALLTLAEGMRDREMPVEAIRIARSLVAQRDGEWDERLLRIVFPLLYEDVIRAEANRAGVDPLLYAALVRQESTFRHSVKSWVGATGLGQIMPSTGTWLASSMGIRNYEQSLLEVPEVNVRLGAKYFGDLLRRYDGAADLALAGYNAGPSRADRWRRTLGYGRDVDRFREAIPFDETRNYVHIVLRNASMYEQLYGD